jgi:hypothetical protein
MSLVQRSLLQALAHRARMLAFLCILAPPPPHAHTPCTRAPQAKAHAAEVAALQLRVAQAEGAHAAHYARGRADAAAEAAPLREAAITAERLQGGRGVPWVACRPLCCR